MMASYCQFKETREGWEDFFHREGLSSELCAEIRTYNAALFVKQVRQLPTMARNEMSSSLLRDVTAHLYREVLSQMPLFTALSEQALTALSLALEPIQRAPGEVIYREGQLDDCMYFLHNGEIQLSMALLTAAQKVEYGAHIHSNVTVAAARRGAGGRGAEPVSWVGIGSHNYRFFRWSISPKTRAYFGEGVLKGDAQNRFATAVSLTWVTLFRLKVVSLKRLSRRFPDLHRVYKRMENSKPSRLKQVVKRIMFVQNLFKEGGPKVCVTIKAAINLPTVDKRYGRCDSFCTVNFEPGVPNSRNTTIVKFNTVFPEWGETFFLPLPPKPPLENGQSQPPLENGEPQPPFGASWAKNGGKSRGTGEFEVMGIRVGIYDFSGAGEHVQLGEVRVDIRALIRTLSEQGGEDFEDSR